MKSGLGAQRRLRMPLAEASAKVRAGGVKDDEEDLAWPVWAGVIPLHTRLGTAQPENGSVEHAVPPTRFDTRADSDCGAA